MYTVTVSSSIEHGKVSVDKTSAEAGATVKLAATADSGYELDSYNVKDEKSNTITVKDGTFTMPESNVTVSATFKETAETVNQKAVAAVIAKITAISTVTYTDESKEKIDDARAAYEALTEAQKELVPEETLALLTAAETKYAELKAAAEPKNASYTVKHFQQNIADNNYTLKESETKTGTVGQPTDASAKSYEGFTAQTVTQVTVAASGTEVEIKYNRNTYTVTFDSNGGSDVSSQSLRYGATATEPADPTKTATTTTKYTFDAWYSDSGLTTPFSFDTAIKKDITLYAKWTETAVTPQKAAGSISYATTSVSKTTAAAAFTNTLTNTGDGAVTYASSKTAVAEVNTQNGLVTIKGAGETTITATVADTDNYTYATKTASYTLTVTEASPLTLKLKTGADINSILVKLCKNDYGYPACTKFARSATNKEEATLYLDTEEKYIPVWSEGTEVYYYVPDGYTPVMNEDSSAMFLFCTELTSLDVTGFDTSNVTNMAGMFYGCSGLTSLDLSKFDTGNVTNMSAMFMGCSGLISLDVSKFVTSSVTGMSYMFSGCEGLTSLDLSKFDTSNVTDMKKMFSGCKELMTIYATDKFVTTSVNNGDDCFEQCSKLVGGSGTTYDENNIYVTYARIDGGPDSASPGYFTLKLIGSKSKPDAVGDIVFSDGSATPYSEGLTLTDEEKNAAIAVIYYAGSASDTLGAKTLGVGLKNTGTDSLLAWAKNIDTNITAIQCTPAYEETEPEPADEETEPADEETAAATATFTGDTDGSDNWKTLCDAVSDEGTSGNYPAWEWVNAYATENSLADSYANGWYLPTVAELSMLYRVKDTVNSALEKAGGTKIADTVYWSSSQVAASYIHTAWTVDFGYGTLDDYGKDVKWSVCTVRAF
jgi:uncharacterized repeat protein (TIGR02543 family)